MEMHQFLCNHILLSVIDIVHQCHISTIFSLSSLYVYLCLLEVIKVIHFEIVLGNMYMYVNKISMVPNICNVFIYFCWFK